MRASWKKARIIKWFVIGVVVLAAVVVALPFILDANQFRPQLESSLSSALGREVKVEKLNLSILSGSIGVEAISIADNPAFSHSPFVSAKSLRISVELTPLIFNKSIHVQGIRLERPSITLISSNSGQWNFSDLGNGNAGQKTSTEGKPAGYPGTGVSISKLEIVDGQVTIVHSGQRRKPSTYNNVNLEIKDLSYTTEFPFGLSASLPGEGTLKLEGKGGPFNTRDMTMTPLEAELEVKHFDLLASGFSGPESGLSSVIDFSGTVNSDGKVIRSKGQASADKLRVVNGGSPANRPVNLQYSLDYNLISRAGKLSDATVEIGKAIAQMNGSYEVRQSDVTLKMMLQGMNMPVEDLTALFPAFGITLPKGASLKGGVLNTNLAAEGPIEKMQLTGTVEINKTRLTGFDLSGKMASLSALAGLQSNKDTEIEKFASALSLTPDGTQVRNLLLIVPAIGELSGSGRIASDQSLDFAMRAMLKPGGTIGSGLTLLVKGGVLNIPFFVRGTASNPKFTPDMKRATGSLLESVMGQGKKEGQSNSSNALQNTLRNLFKKK